MISDVLLIVDLNDFKQLYFIPGKNLDSEFVNSLQCFRRDYESDEVFFERDCVLACIEHLIDCSYVGIDSMKWLNWVNEFRSEYTTNPEKTMKIYNLSTVDNESFLRGCALLDKYLIEEKKGSWKDCQVDRTLQIETPVIPIFYKMG